MKANNKNIFGRTNLQVTSMGFGAAPIGNFLKPIDEEVSATMITEAFNFGLNYFDTAPYYGNGLSEVRLGSALRWMERDSYIVSSKVGRILKPKLRKDIDFTPWVNGLPFEIEYDYSYDGVMRSYEDSLQRMGIERYEIAFIHDIDIFTHGPEEQKVHFNNAMNGAYKALLKLREEGIIKAIGVGVNEWQVCYEALKMGDFDCFLLAGRYTLLEQDSLDEFFPLCEKRNVAVVIGGGYNSGILATGSKKGAKYNYAPAPEHIHEKVREIENCCRVYEVTLAAAALQFILAHPNVPTVIPGTRTVDQLKQNIELIDEKIPLDFWKSLKQQNLIREDAPTPAS
jgi:D-threo-aldose 1-dehydrogenase|tara:strand:+ start:244 stop:1266 length:1023 start_codon:yes stop_codon:yes gene_type:complete